MDPVNVDPFAAFSFGLYGGLKVCGACMYDDFHFDFLDL